jgi:hypothetical protein
MRQSGRAMGKHRSQHQKLTTLLSELQNGTVTKNRDIRAAFGKDDYKIYDAALASARTENDEFKNVERTDDQKEVVEAIKIAQMHSARGTGSEDRLRERVGELMRELSHSEREEMNYWCVANDTGTIEVDWLSSYDNSSIYKELRFHKTVAELKHDVLVEVIEGVLSDKYGENFETLYEKKLIKQKLRALRQDD